MSSSESAAGLAGDEDFIGEILLRLPVKSLIRFKAVSKPWLNLISSPYFSRAHSRRNPNPPPSALCFYRTIPPVPGRLAFHDPFSDVLESASFVPSSSASTASAVSFLDNLAIADGSANVLQSCNGLILCCSCSSYPASDSFSSFYYICNPFTKQFSAIPRPDLKPNKVMAGVNLAYDPLKFHEYSVICIWKSKIGPEIEIYSPSCGHWKPCGEPFQDSTPWSSFSHGVYWNGGIQWHNAGETGLYFDLEAGCVKTMPLPPLRPNFFNHERFVHFGESRGRLYMVEIDTDSKPWLYNVLEMKENRSGWVSKYRIGLYANLVSRFPKIAKGGCKILSVFPGIKGDDLTLVLSVPRKIVSYNLKDGSTDILCRINAVADGGQNHVMQQWYDCLLYQTLAWV